MQFQTLFCKLVFELVTGKNKFKVNIGQKRKRERHFSKLVLYLHVIPKMIAAVNEWAKHDGNRRQNYTNMMPFSMT